MAPPNQQSAMSRTQLSCYCRSNTNVFLTVCPLAFTPLAATVKDLPSADTLTPFTNVYLPSFFHVLLVVVGFNRFSITMSASGLLPVTRMSLLSKLPL